ncbi:MAG: gas vesicle protein GvpJ [Gemmatimonadaceae bacterium]
MKADDERQASPFEEVQIGPVPGILDDEALDLSELLNTVLDRGAVVHGEVTIAVADVDLIKLNIGLLLQAVATAERRVPRDAGVAPTHSLAGAVGALPNRGSPIFETPRAEPQGPTTDARTEAPAKPADLVDGNSGALEQSLNAVAQGLPERINADATAPEAGLARLVLTLIEVLRKVLEHQAVRRMEGGRLSSEEVERLGLALARLNDRMGELKRVFGLSEEDLQIDLGPLGRLK